MQKWYADDSSAVGKLIIVKEWWLKLMEMRPKFSYFPEPSKYILVLKDHSSLQVATQLFADTEIENTYVKANDTARCCSYWIRRYQECFLKGAEMGTGCE